MLLEETMQKLLAMRWSAFSQALEQQLSGETYGSLTFDERVGFLVDAEWTNRQSKSLSRRLALAKLRDTNACIEDIDYRSARGLDRSVIKRLATCRWIKKHQGVMLTGATGSGKTFLGCALCNQACREGYTALYRRLPRLLHEIEAARADGSYPRLLARFAKTDVLMLDDWGTSPLSVQDRRDLFEIMEDRYDVRSTIIASQLPFDSWYESIGDPTIAEAILDRVVHGAHRITLQGESIRKQKAKKVTPDKGEVRS